MVRSLALGFGMVTALAVAGSMTPAGQGMLGQRHPTEDVVQVSSIQDKPTTIPGPSQSLVGASAAPKTVPAAAPVHVAPSTSTVPPAARRPQAPPVAARPQGTGAPPRASQPPQAGQPQGGLGGIAGIANILLNLPQVLDKGRGGEPSHGPDSWSESRPAPGHGSGKAHRWRQGHGDDEKEPGENH
jgi:hypothetical protein